MLHLTPWVFFASMLLTLAKMPAAKADANSFPGTIEGNLGLITESVERAIRTRQVPGAVILVSNQDRVIYRRAFGHRTLEPKKLPMTMDTLFDLASLTKVVATTPALLQLVESGKLGLKDPVAKYWAAFKENGKAEITVQHLLTHYSGLKPGLDLNHHWSSYKGALKEVEEERLVCPPGTRFAYSDINFQILGELLQRISGETLDEYCANHLFNPLGMKNTCFKPRSDSFERVAPTCNRAMGEVHDPTAYRMGGVAGHAGLFSTADDLSIFAQMLLRGGRVNGRVILNQMTVEKMALPQSPPGKLPLRALGWDIGPPFGAEVAPAASGNSYGHKGFTGTLIWIDPVSKTYVIVLTNRLHPNGKGNAETLRSEVLSAVSDAIRSASPKEMLAVKPPPSECPSPKTETGKLKAGIDVLVSQKFEPLVGMRLGLITNCSGIDSAGRRAIDLLSNGTGVRLIAVFSPEHGLSGRKEGKIPTTRDASTGLPVYSLYGENKAPTEKMLHALDALVLDLQDAGVRFYTYMTTMGYAMEAAARMGLDFYVLDRPNPLTALYVQGPVMDDEFRSFTGYFPLPVRHGMTMGELAAMFNVENRIGAKLHVVKMEGYRRSKWYDETGWPWVSPSPNLRNLTSAILYPGVAILEGANVSVGRGTDRPFEFLGAPWIRSKELTEYLNHRRIRGVRFVPVDFRPKDDRFAKRLCHGVRIVLHDREALDSPALGVELASALARLYPKHFQVHNTLGMVGSREVLNAIKEGRDPKSIAQAWEVSLDQFRQLRSKYLLYE